MSERRTTTSFGFGLALIVSLLVIGAVLLAVTS